jgi:hypothetical protein
LWVQITLGNAALGYDQGKSEAGPTLDSAKQAVGDRAAATIDAIGEPFSY